MAGKGAKKMVLAVSEAKKDFSRIMRESSEHLRFFKIQNVQRHAASASLLIGEEAVDLILARYTFTLQWEEDQEQGLWSIYVPEIDVWGQGETKDQAAEDLLTAVLDYLDVYLEDVPFHLKVGRREHLPYLLRVYLASEDRQAVRRVLGL